MSDMMAQGASHAVTLDKREHVLVSGVSDILEFDENNVLIATSAGKMMIEGSGLKIISLDAESGKLSATGKIDSLSYIDREMKKRGLFSRSAK